MSTSLTVDFFRLKFFFIHFWSSYLVDFDEFTQFGSIVSHLVQFDNVKILKARARSSFPLAARRAILYFDWCFLMEFCECCELQCWLLTITGRNYGDEGYPIPNEDDYYQQEPENNGQAAAATAEVPQSPSISSSTKKTKPMPNESSFFIFSSKNR